MGKLAMARAVAQAENNFQGRYDISQRRGRYFIAISTRIESAYTGL
jgi:hypothetical protein